MNDINKKVIIRTLKDLAFALLIVLISISVTGIILILKD